MTLKSFLSQFNIINEARAHSISIWHSPQFLFFAMGIIIIFSTVISYVLGIRYIEDPLVSVSLILGLASVQLVVAFIITQVFNGLIESNRLKSEFVSIVSHQLRSPLTNLKWALDFLLSSKNKQDATQKNESYLEILSENTARMQELVNDLLIVSRVEQGKLPLQNQWFSFDELVRNIAEEFAPFIRASNINLKIDGQENMEQVYADPARIRQVMGNFLDNAIRYTEKKSSDSDEEKMGSKYIIIRYLIKGKEVRFEVEDNGIGIPKGDQKYIFQKFFRSSNAQRHQTRGSGLGLHIAKAIIEKAGGKIGFTSDQRKGSTFWFILPKRG